MMENNLSESISTNIYTHATNRAQHLIESSKYAIRNTKPPYPLIIETTEQEEISRIMQKLPGTKPSQNETETTQFQFGPRCATYLTKRGRNDINAPPHDEKYKHVTTTKSKYSFQMMHVENFSTCRKNLGNI